MKIQPIEFPTPEEYFNNTRREPPKPLPVVKSRLKRLFERQFLWISEKVNEESNCNSNKDHGSACLESMVQNFIEETDKEKPQAGAVRRCNCFHGSSSEDELDDISGGEISDRLKNMVLCTTMKERDLLAQTWKIVQANKTCKKKDELSRKIIVDSLLVLGYNASVCKSQWNKSPSRPAGEYEYVDVIAEGERYIIDVDFRSEFEIARSTKTYTTLLQMLPYIFVGKADRLQRIISIVSDAAKQSLRKKGMHFPPWRKAEYVKAKWLSSFTRLTPNSLTDDNTNQLAVSVGELEMSQDAVESVFDLSDGNTEEEKEEWKLPEIKMKNGTKIVNGLALIMGN